MTTTDLIALFALVMTSGGIAFGVVTWAADRRYKNQEKLEAITRSPNLNP